MSVSTTPQNSSSELTSALDKCVLTPLALKIVCDLLGRRLADIDDGAARQMLRAHINGVQTIAILVQQATVSIAVEPKVERVLRDLDE
jgi:hypothetical protein